MSGNYNPANPPGPGDYNSQNGGNYPPPANQPGNYPPPANQPGYGAGYPPPANQPNPGYPPQAGQPGNYPPPPPQGYPQQPGSYPPPPQGYPAQPGSYPPPPQGYPAQPPANANFGRPVRGRARNGRAGLIVLGVIVLAMIVGGVLYGTGILSNVDAPAYPGATKASLTDKGKTLVDSFYNNNKSDSENRKVFITSDDPQKVLDFYKTTLTKDGWTVKDEGQITDTAEPVNAGEYTKNSQLMYVIADSDATDLVQNATGKTIIIIIQGDKS